MEQLVEDKTRNLQLHIASLRVYQEALEQFPFAVIGLDDSCSVVLENRAARKVFSNQGTSLLGLPLNHTAIKEWDDFSHQIQEFSQQTTKSEFQFSTHNQNILMIKLGANSSAVGHLLFSFPLHIGEAI